MGRAGKTFCLVMIKPSHYDDDGYPIQWFRSDIPSNTLAAVNGLALDSIARKVLGPDVEIRLATFDETNIRIRPDKIIANIRANGQKIRSNRGRQKNTTSQLHETYAQAAILAARF